METVTQPQTSQTMVRLLTFPVQEKVSLRLSASVNEVSDLAVRGNGEWSEPFDGWARAALPYRLSHGTV